MTTWSRSRRAVLVACLAAGFLQSGPAHAQPAASGDGDAQLSPSERIAKHANELYQQGQYREAIAEYSEAARLDPNAPILVRNIAVLHEKLGEVDAALDYFRRYGKMEISADERKRNEIDIRRLEGAKKELEEKERIRRQQEAQRQPPPPRPVEQPAHGRIDALTIGFGAGAVAALAVGTILGLKASADRPPSGFVTGRDGTYTDLSSKASTAHHEAIGADVCFGVAIGAGVTAALLYALRTKDPEKPRSEKETTPSVSAGPLAGGGGAVLVRGAF